MRLKTLFWCGAALVWLILAQSAFGATVGLSIGSFDGESHMVYEAAVGEINDVTIVEGPRGVYLITDLNAANTPQTTRCKSISPNTVRCDFGFPDDDPVVDVHTRDGADSVDVNAGPNINGYGGIVAGGADPDTLSATRSSDLFGDLGDDRLVGRGGHQGLQGGEGADWLDGGPGDDYLEGGGGPDVIAGGPGRDVVDYGTQTAAVRISLDDRPNDGAAGEGDWVRADVESAAGSKGPTTFIGNAGPNTFFGYFGGGAGDVVKAGAGDDRILGASGRDVLSGGAGDDFLEGYNGADVIRGGGEKTCSLGNGVQTTSAVGGETIVCLEGARTTSSGAAPVMTVCQATAAPTSSTPGIEMGRESVEVPAMTARRSTP